MQIRYILIGLELKEDNVKEEFISACRETYVEIEESVAEESIVFETIQTSKTYQLLRFSITNVDDVFSDGALKSFEQRLVDMDGVVRLVKLYDSVLSQYLQETSTKIFELEMLLRETLCVVFFKEYDGDVDNFLEDYEVKLQLEKDYRKNKGKRDSYTGERLETCLFYLLFSDYSMFDESGLRPLSESDILGSVQVSKSFAEFRRMLMERGVVDENHRDFLSSIKEHLLNIEKMRNCVAHNRGPSDTILANFDNSYEALSAICKDFLSTL